MKNYGPFEKRIGKVLVARGVPKASVAYFDGWSRNLTRHVYVERARVTAEVVDALFSLSRRKYEHWRIELILVRSIEKYDEVGHLAIRKDWALCHGGVARRLVNDVKRLHS